MKSKFSKLDELRIRAYNSYESLLKGKEQISIVFPEFKNTGKLIFCYDEIEDDDYQGKTYLAGELVSSEGIGNGFNGYLINSENGIKPFEEYSFRGYRPSFVTRKGNGLIIDRNCLEKFPQLNEDHSIEEVIGLNFSFFPLLFKEKSRLSHEDYFKFYTEIWLKNPILF